MSRIVRSQAGRPVPSGAGPLAAGLRCVAAAGVLAALTACYTYSPLYTAPPPGVRVALELNDRGRVALEQNVGPEVAVVEGVLEAVTDSDLVLSVREVRGLYGSRSRWDGERVTFRHEHVRTMRERRYSAGRTFALVTAVTSSTLAFMVTRTLLGGGRTDPDGTLPPPGDDQ